MINSNLLALNLGWFTDIFYIIIALLILLLMVTIHEFGHYIAGKKLGFKINEFSVGFGKSIYSKKTKSGEIFSLRLIPLGGYCAFEGEDEDSKNPDAFNNQKPWKRLIVLFAGAGFNILSAIIFSFILLVTVGYDVPEITSINEDSVNYGVIQSGDVIREIDDVEIDFIKDNTFTSLLSEYDAGDPITLTVTRDGEELTKDVTLYEKEILDENGEGTGNFANVLGITVTPYSFTFLEALARCIPFTFGLAWKILEFLILLIIGKVGLSGVGGPITTISTIATFTQASAASILVLMPLIAVNLGVFNLLPLPALDGSRMVFTVVEWIRGKPINRTVEAYIHFIGLIVLFGFVILADVYNLVL